MQKKTCESSLGFSEPLPPSFQATIIVKWWLFCIYENKFFKNELGKIPMIKTVTLFGGFLKNEIHNPQKVILTSNSIIWHPPSLTELQIYNHSATVHHPRMTWHNNTRRITPTATASFSSHLSLPHAFLQKVLINRNGFRFPYG